VGPDWTRITILHRNCFKRLRIIAVTLILRRGAGLRFCDKRRNEKISDARIARKGLKSALEFLCKPVCKRSMPFAGGFCPVFASDFEGADFSPPSEHSGAGQRCQRVGCKTRLGASDVRRTDAATRGYRDRAAFHAIVKIRSEPMFVIWWELYLEWELDPLQVEVGSHIYGRHKQATRPSSSMVERSICRAPQPEGEAQCPKKLTTPWS